MGGGLINIVEYGAQDEYLSGDPDITFFKVAYRKHANFAMETIQQDLNISGNDAVCNIRRDGDLIINAWIECENTDPDVDKRTGLQKRDRNGDPVIKHRDGTEMIDKVEFLIGGQLIETHYGAWYKMWNELSTHRRNIDGYNMLINKNKMNKTNKAYIPLKFFFCKSTGLALPLIALKYHEVSIKITFTDTNVTNKKLYVDYVFLEQEERIRFAQKDHDILIEQVQYSGKPDFLRNNKFLQFSHPVKELIWSYAGNPKLKGDDYKRSKTGKEISIKLNDFYKIKDREDMYFTHIQPYQHHSNVPESGNIYTYSFALKPEEYQPTGSCNFSRLRTAQILSNDPKYGLGIEVYAINYNVLKITSGMGGLLFAT